MIALLTVQLHMLYIRNNIFRFLKISPEMRCSLPQSLDIQPLRFLPHIHPHLEVDLLLVQPRPIRKIQTHPDSLWARLIELDRVCLPFLEISIEWRLEKRGNLRQDERVNSEGLVTDDDGSIAEILIFPQGGYSRHG